VTTTFDMRGQVAVITGGCGGIGLAIARRLQASGAVIALWDIDGPRVTTAAQAFVNGRGYAVDVTDETSVTQALAATLADFGRVDILVTAAGVTGPNLPLVEYDAEVWRRTMAINLDGVFLCCKAVAKVMVDAGYGRIVNISSIGGKEGNANASCYCAAKAGVIALTKSLGKELAHTDVRVNTIAPAAIETELLKQMTPEFTRTVLAKIPMGRFGQADEVAAMVAWLASPECSFSTGAVFDLSGGRATY